MEEFQLSLHTLNGIRVIHRYNVFITQHIKQIGEIHNTFRLTVDGESFDLGDDLRIFGFIGVGLGSKGNELSDKLTWLQFVR